MNKRESFNLAAGMLGGRRDGAGERAEHDFYIRCGKNGNFEGCSSMMAQAWFIWQKGYKGETTVKWF